MCSTRPHLMHSLPHVNPFNLCIVQNERIKMHVSACIDIITMMPLNFVETGELNCICRNQKRYGRVEWIGLRPIEKQNILYSCTDNNNNTVKWKRLDLSKMKIIIIRRRSRESRPNNIVKNFALLRSLLFVRSRSYRYFPTVLTVIHVCIYKEAFYATNESRMKSIFMP